MTLATERLGKPMLANQWLRVISGISAVAVVGAFAYGAHRFLKSDRATPETKRLAAPALPETSPLGSKVTVRSVPDEQAGESVGEETTKNTLSVADRKFIWDIEHVALLLDVRVFPRMARAIRDDDIAGLMDFMSDDFAGRVPGVGHAHSATYPFGEFHWLTNDDDGWNAANRQQFVAYLISQRALFPEPPKAEIRLMRLAPVDRAALDGPWHGTMKIRLAGEQPNGQPLDLELLGQFELDAPGDDIEHKNHWLKSCVISSARSNAASRFLMMEVASSQGIDRNRFHDNWDQLDKDPIVARGGAFVCDYDKDGRLDVLITDQQAAVLFQGQSDGSFRDATESAGLASAMAKTAAPAVFADFDGDGYEDLLFGTQLFRNNRDGTFSDITRLTNLRLPTDTGGFAIADYDLDGRVDLYVVRSSPGPAGHSRVSWVDDQSGPGNQLWRNIGGWQFRNVTSSTNASAGHRSCFSAVWLDANGDGRPDLAVADEFGSSVLLVNQAAGRFTEQLLKPPFAGFCMGIVAGDFDNDGRPDVYLANMFSKAGDRIIANLPADAYSPEVRAKIKEFVNGSELLRNRGDLTFEPMGRRMGVNGIGWAYGPSMVDLNNDGWLDLYATAGFLSYTRGEPDG